MQRQTVVLVMTSQGPEVWGSLKKACNAHGFSYGTLVRKAFPFEHERHAFYRVPFDRLTKPKTISILDHMK